MLKDYYESFQDGFPNICDQYYWCNRTSKSVTIQFVFKNQLIENHAKEKPKVSETIPLSELINYTKATQVQSAFWTHAADYYISIF